MSNAVQYDPKSFFFTEPGAFTQAGTQAFGPASADEFRLTAGLTVSGNAPAYAVCKGVVLIQPQSGAAGKVNLILRPFSQPITGLNIKYFIYRGLDQADFFDGDTVLPATTGASDLVNLVNAGFADYYAHAYPGETVPPFLAKYLGFDPAGQADTLLMDDVFFKQASVTAPGGTPTEEEELAFELPLIPMGASLGRFAPGECGMDVVLNFGDYRLPQPNDEFVFDLAYARAAASVISVAAISDAFKKKQVKEQIFQFLDIAAFYGFHAGEGGSVRVKGTTEDAVKKGVQVYNDLLAPFDTKNRVYLYIQSDRTRSYNFYGNYLIGESGPECLKLGATDTALAARDYSDTGWPLLIDHDPRSGSEAVNNIYLQLVTDNNDNAMLYGQIAGIVNAEGNNFCGALNLRLPVAAGEAPANLTKVIVLGNPSVSSGGAKVNIATFNMLVYQGKAYSYNDDTNSDDTEGQVSTTRSAIDDLFGNLMASAITKSNTAKQYDAVSDQRVRIINYRADEKQFGISAVQTQRVSDKLETTDTQFPVLTRTTYVTEAVESLNNVIAPGGSLTTNNSSKPSSFSTAKAAGYALPLPFYYNLKPFTESGEVINGIELKTKDQSLPDKLIIGLTDTEDTVIKALINSSITSNQRLFLTDSFGEDNALISSDNITYKKYQIGILEEDVAGVLKLIQPQQAVYVYTLDQYYFFSKAYSQYMKEDPLSTLVLDLDIAL